MKEDTCALCAASLPREDFCADYSLVTSDSRPFPQKSAIKCCKECGLVQRLHTRQWKQDCEKIYSTYHPYRRGEDSEQKIAGPAGDALLTRSKAVITKFVNSIVFDHSGAWLDIGCGQGQLLQECSMQLPELDLYGYDITTANKSKIELLPNARFISNLDNYPHEMDVVSIFHVLEHTATPVDFLKRAIQPLGEKGVVLVQVPSFVANPFDLMIYDHGLFFSKPTLRNTLECAGLQVSEIRSDWVNRELTAICTVSCKQDSSPLQVDFDAGCGVDLLVRHQLWLDSLIAEGRGKQTTGPVDIFGSSIGATWLASQIGPETVNCFIDQDATRWGFELLGRPIVEPTKVNLREALFPIGEKLKEKVLKSVEESQE